MKTGDGGEVAVETRVATSTQIGKGAEVKAMVRKVVIIAAGAAAMVV